MELQFDLDLDFPQGQDDIKIPIPNGTWTVHHHLREVNMNFLVKRMQIWWVSYVSGTQPCSHFAGAGLEFATI